MHFSFRISLFVFVGLLGTFTSISSQTPIAEATRGAEIPATWPGCDAGDCTKNKLDEFIEKNLVMPAAAKAQDAGGVVLVEFVIEKNGTIGEIKALHDPGLGLGTAATDVIAKMKSAKIKWTPAEDKGKRVPSRYMTPVSFNLFNAVKPERKPVVAEVVPDVYDVVDIMPRYAGCEPSVTDTIDCTFRQMVSHIQTNLNYPDSAIAVGAQGPVVVEFIIDSKGNITKPTVNKGLGYGCDEEAIRVISLMPIWQPGLQGGKPVAVRMVVPILFQAPKEEEKE